jgi:glutamate-1-semialdehyde aminotransferase
MTSVTALALLFCFVSLLYQRFKEQLVFFSKSNFKYKFLDALASFIHYGPDVGMEESLQLDSPSPKILERRRQGQDYLSSKLAISDNDNNDSSKPTRGQVLSPKLVDCRFSLQKVLLPLLRELEFPPKRNFVCEVEPTDDGMHQVVLDSDKSNDEKLSYLGNDAVHILGMSFYEPIQREINRRMLLPEANLKFTPIALHPELERNATTILKMTKMDQVRYSLSGSEAMDGALKDIQASCRGKRVVVRFSSAYHGHVSGVDFLNCQNHIFLKECDPASFEFIEKYHYRIAAVVVNPMQHFTGINKPSPPGEKLTLGKRERHAVGKQDYAKWLHALQAKCNYCTKYLSQTAFVMDDIYFALRTPELFSFRYFTDPETGAELSPDVLVLGKGIAAGYPLSMVLGKKGFLNTYDKKYLLQVNKTVGTLAAWYGGLVASNVFLDAMQNEQVAAQQQLADMVTKFNAFSSTLNAKFQAKNLPLSIRNFSNTFSINYLNNSLYNSRYPQYCMAEGIFLGNYSTGKFNLNNDASEADWEAVSTKLVNAATLMQEHGYFEPYSSSEKKKLLARCLGRFTVNYLRIFYDQVMQDKHIDISVSHNHPVNKFGHFWSSVGMILLAYPYCIFGDPIQGCIWFLLTHTVRQSGHFFYEHQDRDIEKLKFGHKDGSKKESVAFLTVAGLVYYYRSVVWEYTNRLVSLQELQTSQYVSLVATLTILPHMVEIIHQWGWMRGISWMLKILTDPFTDLGDFYEYAAIHPKWFLDFKDTKAIYKLDIASKKVLKVA